MKSAFFVFLSFALSSCFLREGRLSKSKKLLRRGFCEKSFAAFHEIQRLSEKDLAFGRRAARRSQKKNPACAMLFYERLLEKIAAGELSQAPSFTAKRLFREKKDLRGEAARMAFYRLKNYEKAIRHYKELIKQGRGEPARQRDFSAQYHISESFFRLKKFRQALLEIKKIPLNRLSDEEARRAMLLRARALAAQKNLKEALPLFQRLIARFPAKSGFFRQYLSMAFEGEGNLPAAIQELEKIRPPTPFIRKKIRRLRRRLENQPGAGL